MSNHLQNAKYVSSITILRFGDWIPRALGGGQLKYYWNFHPKTWGFMIQFDQLIHIFPMGWQKTTNSSSSSFGCSHFSGLDVVVYSR